MKVALAQTMPVKGDVGFNSTQHKKFIALALSSKADMILFPELSITGYEPELAKKLATTIDDIRFDDFQNISNRKNITICIGAPLKADNGVLISMIIFQPGQVRKVYSKRYLHPDEKPYFINGQEQIFLGKDNHMIAPAICYELSVPEHAKNAYANSADIYLVSVAKTTEGIDKAAQTLSHTAAIYSMTILLSNCVGYCDNFLSGGRSSVWNKKGGLVGKLNDTDQGLLVFDTETERIIEQYIIEKQASDK
jgi:predicted amidohydrolase